MCKHLVGLGSMYESRFWRKFIDTALWSQWCNQNMQRNNIRLLHGTATYMYVHMKQQNYTNYICGFKANFKGKDDIVALFSGRDQLLVAFRSASNEKVNGGLGTRTKYCTQWGSTRGLKNCGKETQLATRSMKRLLHNMTRDTQSGDSTLTVQHGWMMLYLVNAQCSKRQRLSSLVINKQHLWTRQIHWYQEWLVGILVSHPAHACLPVRNVREFLGLIPKVVSTNEIVRSVIIM